MSQIEKSEDRVVRRLKNGNREDGVLETVCRERLGLLP